MKIKLKHNNSSADDYKDLSIENEYRVIGIEADKYRIVSDEGLPYLYPNELFIVVNNEIPSDWETSYGEDGERYSYPRELGEPGFFEDYFDGKRDSIAKFRYYLSQSRR